MRPTRALGAADLSRRHLWCRTGAPAGVAGWGGLVCALLLVAPASFAQRNPVPRPVPLNPVEGSREGRELVADMLAQRPERNTTNTGSIRIVDASGNERIIPAQFEIYSTPTNWVSVYHSLPTPSGPAPEKLTVIHTDEQANRYELTVYGGTGDPNAVTKVLARDQLMVPFAGSDFWIADLGLEFLHWPTQRVLTHEMRHSKSCKVLESINPSPVPGSYSRVVSWIMIERPHGIVHADAYDTKNEVLKRFDPKNVEKIEGAYQLEEMEMRNIKTGSRTFIKFNLQQH